MSTQSRIDQGIEEAITLQSTKGETAVAKLIKEYVDDEDMIVAAHIVADQDISVDVIDGLNDNEMSELEYEAELVATYGMTSGEVKEDLNSQEVSNLNMVLKSFYEKNTEKAVRTIADNMLWDGELEGHVSDLEAVFYPGSNFDMQTIMGFEFDPDMDLYNLIREAQHIHVKENVINGNYNDMPAFMQAYGIFLSEIEGMTPEDTKKLLNAIERYDEQQSLAVPNEQMANSNTESPATPKK